VLKEDVMKIDQHSHRISSMASLKKKKKSISMCFLQWRRLRFQMIGHGFWKEIYL